MIPLKLKLKNFLSYGSDVQTIDFSPYQLICFSGKNGHGKSALLDAITWAIWGQARKVSGAPKADASLLRLGQTQMMVCLDFICNGQTYRVKREYAKTYGKPYNALDFGIVNQKDDTVMPLTDKTIRATQQKIETTIHLTFDAFTNSAFLRQGQANEFSKKSPKERKEIFAQILGLQQYEAVRKLAMDRAKEASAQKSGIVAFQEKIELELQKKDQLDVQLKELENNLKACTKKEAQLLENQKKLNKEKTKRAEQQKAYELLQFRITELNKKEQELQKQHKEIQNTWNAIQKQQKTLPNYKTAEDKKKELSATVATFQKAVQERLKLKEQLLVQTKQLQEYEKIVQQKQLEVQQQKQTTVDRLQLKLEAHRKKHEELTATLQTKEKEQKEITLQCAKLQKIIEKYDVDEQKIQKQEEALSAGKEQYQKLIALANVTQQELRNLHQKRLLAGDEHNPCCPLCEQNLSASRKKFLKTKFSHQETDLQKKLGRFSTEIKGRKEQLVAQHKNLETQKKQWQELHKQKTEYDAVQKKQNEHTEEITNIKKQCTQEDTAFKKLKTDFQHAQKDFKMYLEQSKKQLHEDPAYKKLLTSLQDTEKKITACTYDETKHKKAVAQLKQVEEQLQACARLREQVALQEERKKQIDALSKSIDLLTTQKQKFEKEVIKHKELKTEIEKHQKKEQELLTTAAQHKKEKELLLQEKGALENQKKKLKELSQEQKKQHKRVCELNEVVEDYQEIAAATSKNGIQALLIENAIPEVEQEANRLLGKLTNNQAQIFIESLRDLKKGGTKETLDIKISDTAGIRPYELFSGGEAFRIDFALRIAISKLLARRAGTALQTLIIDEGFGSQDEEGLAHIMDAIYKIQDDFIKVIVVSHLPTMKDQFPVHFFVQKTTQGSFVDVVQMG